MATNFPLQLGIAPSLNFADMKKAVNFNYKWVIDTSSTNFVNLESPVFSNETNSTIEWRMKIDKVPAEYEDQWRVNPRRPRDDFRVKLFLVTSDLTNIQTICKLQLLNVVPKATVTVNEKLQFDTYGIGYDCFDIKQEFFNRENGFLFDDNTFTVTCEINGVVEISIPHTIPKCTLLDDLEVLFENREFTDFTFCVLGKEFLVHKAILAARSPVFNAMFNHEMKESLQNQVVIDEVDSEVFREFLRFIYTGKVSNLDEIAIELLPLADKYGLESLKMLCEKGLCNNITIENAAEVLILAHQHNLAQLKTVAIGYIGSMVVTISKTDGWNLMIRSHPDLVTEVLCDVSIQLQVMTVP